MEGFSIIMEMIDFSLTKTFLNEFLYYLRMLFDISVNNSTKLIHQYLKSIFFKNAKYLILKTLQTLRIRDSTLLDGISINIKLIKKILFLDVFEMSLFRSIDDFTVFAAFILRPEYLESSLILNSGWIYLNAFQKNLSNINSLDISDSLHLFDPFITRLIQIYPLTNNPNIRIAVFF